MTQRDATTSTIAPLTLPCLVEFDEATDQFVGHCLTYDLVSTAKTKRAAFDNLKTLIKRHIEYLYTHHKAGFQVTADEVDWNRWRDMVNSGRLHAHSVERIEVDLQEPWNTPAFWADVVIEKENEGLEKYESSADPLCATR